MHEVKDKRIIALSLTDENEMKHLSNISNPFAPLAELHHIYSCEAMFDKILRDQEWWYHMEWVNSNIVSLPKATERYSQQQLINMGMVGIYSNDM